MDVPNYAGATNITVTERAVSPGPGLAPAPHTVVRFNVGTHGPFELTYPTASFKPEIAKSDIAARVQQINTVLQAQTKT